MTRVQSPSAHEPAAEPTTSGRAAAQVFGLRQHYLEQLDGRIAYLDEGSGPVVLLVHGAPLTSLAFVRVIRELQKHHRVVAPDLPGFGQSERSPGFSGSLSDYARFVERFCEALDLRDLVLYVNDASGCFGLAAAASMPRRIAGLVVADTAPLPLTGPAWIVRQLLTHVLPSRPVRFINRRFNLLARLVAKVAPFLRRFTRVESDALVAQFDTLAKRDRILDLFEQMGRDVAFMERTADAIRDHLSALPTLILYGQFDPMRLIGGVGRFRALFRQSVVQIIPREEHFPILASGQRIGQAVHRWASERVPARAYERAQVSTRSDESDVAWGERGRA